MFKMKKYIISLSVMILVSIILLVLVSALTYLFKWQADKAMIGIIVTYVLGAFAGGLGIKSKRKMLAAVVLGTVYIFLLAEVAYLGLHIPFELSKKFLLIWLLVVCSAYVGVCLKR